MSLKVLNASAGSGKTYNLVKEYLSILLSEPYHTDVFSRIIAMTFTNKAALEMKNRIVDRLDLLSYPLRNEGEALRYANELSVELGITATDVQQRAQKIMQNLLHSYEDFSVMTIDKFNLRLIRSFSRDLDLPADFEVILNEKEVIAQVIDKMLTELGKESQTKLTQLVLQYSTHNVDEGNSWNVRNQLAEFASVLSKEKDKAITDQLLQMNFDNRSFKELKENAQVMKKAWMERCASVGEIYNRYESRKTSFPKGAHTYNSISKIHASVEIPSDSFLSKSALSAIYEPVPDNKFFPEELRDALIDLINFHGEIKVAYFSNQLFIRNFHDMALLKFIASALETMKHEEQLIRISEFNSLISELVKEEFAPFIYERLGVRFRHFLLDEFQDTSRLQWLNMVPLLHESLSNGYRNLIVGDAKQSIYRFKNGVAEQFVALPAIYNPENDPMVAQRSEYFEQQAICQNLEENWRSTETIVTFNNIFFRDIIGRFPLRTQGFYQTIEQIPKSTQIGLVDIVSVPEKLASTTDLMDLVVQRINECLADGYGLADICILSETNNQTNNWAVELTKRNYKVVSSDSLLIKNDLKVRLTISFLRLRLKPHSDSEVKRFTELFFRLSEQKNFADYRSYFVQIIKEDGKQYTSFEFDRFITEHIGSKETFFRKYENLHDLLMGFYLLMNWNELRNPYLHHFADFVHEFELKKGPDLAGLLTFYDEKKGSLAIQVPESDDAMQIMTIHKAKGLEFPIVILPCIDLRTSVESRSKHLVQIDNHVVYTTLSQKSPIEQIAAVKSREEEDVLTDKLNQCYVAFTRPRERLYVINYHDTKRFGAIAHACLNDLPGSKVDGEILHVRLGDRTKLQSTDRKSQTKWFIPQGLKDRLWFPEVSLRRRDELNEQTELTKEQRFGNQFHALISAVDNPSCIEQQLHKMLIEGEIEASFEKALREQTTKVLMLPGIQKLYENAVSILSEQSIILHDEALKRPDKLILKSDETILLEFKTGMQHPKHISQVEEYTKALQEMELPNVSGYIYYTATELLVRLG
jgi:ATP-dependent exoDNAse (exonuclease V) beta subunit